MRHFNDLTLTFTVHYSPFNYGECQMTTFRPINGAPRSWTHDRCIYKMGIIQIQPEV